MQIINTKDFVTKQAKGVLDATMKVALEMRKDMKAQQVEHVSLTCTIITNIMFSVWCTVKVMSSRKEADEFLNNLFAKIRKAIKQKTGDSDEEKK